MCFYVESMIVFCLYEGVNMFLCVYECILCVNVIFCVCMNVCVYLWPPTQYLGCRGSSRDAQLPQQFSSMPAPSNVAGSHAEEFREPCNTRK